MWVSETNRVIPAAVSSSPRMLMELAGQQRIHLPLEPHLRCSPRVDQLARPADLKPPEDITQRTDFAGLFHVA